MTWIVRGAIGLAAALTAGIAVAQPCQQVCRPAPGAYPPPAYTEAAPGYTHDWGRLDDRYSPPDYRTYRGSDDRGYERWSDDGRGYDYGRYDDRRDDPPARDYDAARRDDRYGPAPDDRYAAYDDEVPSYGGAMQHYADPRCDTCSQAARRWDCGCGQRVSYSGSVGEVRVGPAFFYDYGGVGPIPDGGYYGGGGYAVMGEGSGSASASARAFASSSSHVSVNVRSGSWGGKHGGGGWKGGGCNSCGGHH